MRPSKFYSCLCAVFTAACIGNGSAATANNTGHTVTVTVKGIELQEGNILAALYDESGWSAEAIDRAREAVTGDVVQIILTAPQSGQYGIQLFHDVNSNGKLDTNLVGIPTEPFGFSNNAPPGFGAPSFADAAFNIGDNGAEQTIELR